MNPLEKILAGDPKRRKSDAITKIYRGLDHCCRCGCGGNYAYSGERTFKRYLNEMRKEDFRVLETGSDMYTHDGRTCKCEGIEYGSNFINIPFNGRNDKCFCLYFD